MPATAPAVPESYWGFSPNQWVLMAGMAILLVTILRWRTLVVKQQEKSKAAAPPAVSPSALNVREVAAELQALLADLEETSRRLTAQLDNRHTRLEQLVAEADAKIAKLESLLKHGAEAATSPGPTVAIEAQSALERLRQERSAPPPEVDPAYQPIYALADRGKSPREIAQELGRQPGEIELILALRRGKRVG
jgi:hypothetical protein